MKKFLITSILATVTFTGTALANPYADIEIFNQENQGVFHRFTGSIVNISENTITVSDTGEMFSGISFHFTNDTFILGDLEEGTTVTAFYRADAPMTASLPPQVTASAIVSSSEATSVALDLFLRQDDTDGLLSSDNMLLINIAETTQIEDTQGELVDWDINGFNLLVIYDISTRSIPALTTPSRIIVLQDMVTGIMPQMPVLNQNSENNNDLEQEGHDMTFDHIDLDNLIILMPTVDPIETFEWSNYPIIVEGSGLSLDFVELNDTIYVPLRAVIDSLGGIIEWEPAYPRIQIIWANHAFLVYVGTNEFTRDAETIILDSPSVLIGSTTYVPLSFFREVLGFNNAYFHGGHVQINNLEIMQ